MLPGIYHTPEYNFAVPASHKIGTIAICVAVYIVPICSVVSTIVLDTEACIIHLPIKL